MPWRWPAWLADNAAHVTDVGRSWWILTLTTLALLGSWAWRRLSNSQRAGAMTAQVAAMAAYILVSVGLAALIVNILKRLIGRPRPVEFADHGLFSVHPLSWNFDFESFPSGHSTVNGALFMALALLFPRYRWLLLVLGLGFALTRVFVGAHYPSDVAAGLLLGLWTAIATAFVFARQDWLFRFDEKGWPLPKSLLPK